MSNRLCAIHQPNFFPWLGFFDKIRRADVFVLLDRVDYPRAGSGGMGSWVNRVRVMAGGEPRWVGCPVRRMPLGGSISEALVDDSQPWRIKLLKTLQANYAKAPRFAEGLALLEPLILAPETNLALFNMTAIKTVATHLGLQARIVLQSELAHEGKATNLLVSLTEAAGCTAYLAGGGAGGYQDDTLFEQRGIQLRYQDFEPQAYGDPDRFTPGLSVIDYLMQDGRPLNEVFPDA